MVRLDIQGISFAREVVIPIYYKGRHVGTRRVDFLIEGIISTELKAVISMDDGHLCQGLNYLEAFKMETGLLINFGSKRLQYKRLFNTKYKE